MATTETTGYFHYHGNWAIGIRLFRALNFGAKAAVILLPMLGLLT